MKKILLAAVAALAFVGCTQNEEIEKLGDKAEINFTGVVMNSTRAAITTKTNFDKFTVNAYKTTASMSGDVQLTDNFMNNVLVSKEGESWTPNGTFYWPLTEKVQFFGTSPAQSLNITAKGYPKFEYTVKDISSQEDLLAANVVDKVKGVGAIALPFQHLLTQVNFSIKGDMENFTYTVSEIVLKGINDKATFTFNGESTTGSWSTATASTDDLAYTYTSTVVVAPTTAAPDLATKFEAENTALFMLMPQTLDKATLDITYTAAPTQKPTEYTFNGQKTVSLTGTWEMGKNNRYTLKLTSDASPVTFGEPSVDGWVDQTVQPGDVTTPAK